MSTLGANENELFADGTTLSSSLVSLVRPRSGDFFTGVLARTLVLDSGEADALNREFLVATLFFRIGWRQLWASLRSDSNFEAAEGVETAVDVGWLLRERRLILTTGAGDFRLHLVPVEGVMRGFHETDKLYIHVLVAI